MGNSFKSEFQVQKFGFSHHDQEDFVAPIARGLSPSILLAVRVFFSLYTISFMIVSAVTDDDGTWIEFLTSWNYILVVFYFAVASLVSVVAFVLGRQQSTSSRTVQIDPEMVLRSPQDSRASSSTDQASINDKDSINFLQKVSWFFFAVVFNSSTHVTVLYWAALHDYDNDNLGIDLDTYLLIDRHGLNQLLVYIDFILNATPVRVLHFVYPLSVLTIYIIFNVSFWASTGRILYPILNYDENPGKAAGVLIGGLFLVSTCQFALYGLYRLKLKIFGRDIDEFV